MDNLIYEIEPRLNENSNAKNSQKFINPHQQRKKYNTGVLTKTVTTTESQAPRGEKLPTEQKYMFGSLAVMKMKLFNISRAVDEMGKRTSIQQKGRLHSLTFFLSRNAEENERINFIWPRTSLSFSSTLFFIIGLVLRAQVYIIQRHDGDDFDNLVGQL